MSDFKAREGAELQIDAVFTLHLHDGERSVSLTGSPPRGKAPVAPIEYKAVLIPVSQDVVENKEFAYYIKNQQDAALAVLFIGNCKIPLYVSDAFCVHPQEY